MSTLFHTFVHIWVLQLGFWYPDILLNLKSSIIQSISNLIPQKYADISFKVWLIWYWIYKKLDISVSGTLHLRNFFSRACFCMFATRILRLIQYLLFNISNIMYDLVFLWQLSHNNKSGINKVVFATLSSLPLSTILSPILSVLVFLHISKMTPWTDL